MPKEEVITHPDTFSGFGFAETLELEEGHELFRYPNPSRAGAKEEDALVSEGLPRGLGCETGSV